MNTLKCVALVACVISLVCSIVSLVVTIKRRK